MVSKNKHNILDVSLKIKKLKIKKFYTIQDCLYFNVLIISFSVVIKTIPCEFLLAI